MEIPALPDPVDGLALRTVLDGRWAHVRDRARRRLRFTPRGAKIRDDLDTYRATVAADLRELAATGHARVAFPAEYGGTGDIGASIVSFEMLGFGDLSLMVKAGVQWGLFGGAVQFLGTADQRARYLRPIMELTLLGCFAMTESGNGSDPRRLRTTATYEPVRQEFVVHTPDDGARKDFIGNAARDARVAVVFAQLRIGRAEHGVHALLVPIRDAVGRSRPGVTISDCGPKAGLNGLDDGRLSFDHVRVPRDALLNRFGDVAPNGRYTSELDSPNLRIATMLGALVRGRVSVAGAVGSATKAALTIAVRYADHRHQFTRQDTGKPFTLLDYLAQQRRLLPALATTYALHFAQEELVCVLHEIQTSTDAVPPRRQRELEARASGLKAIGTWHATRTIQECREACGGAGYLAENRLPQLKADTDVFTTFEGDNTVLLQLVAKGLLTDFAYRADDLGSAGLADHLAEQFTGASIEHTTAHSRLAALVADGERAGPADLLDRGRQVRLFEDRECHLIDGLARRLRTDGDDSGDPFDAFNDAQDHIQHAARAFVERTVLEAFIAAIGRCGDPATTTLLERLCDLFVLSVIERDRAWFLEHERLTPAAGRTVTATVNALCRSIRPHAQTLVDGFGIPQHWLAAVIAEPA